MFDVGMKLADETVRLDANQQNAEQCDERVREYIRRGIGPALAHAIAYGVDVIFSPLFTMAYMPQTPLTVLTHDDGTPYTRLDEYDFFFGPDPEGPEVAEEPVEDEQDYVKYVDAGLRAEGRELIAENPDTPLLLKNIVLRRIFDNYVHNLSIAPEIESFDPNDPWIEQLWGVLVLSNAYCAANPVSVMNDMVASVTGDK